MESRFNQAPPAAIVEMLEQVSRKGVKLWSQDGQLRYKAPKGALTPTELQRLSASGDEIVALLQKIGTRTAVPRLSARSEREIAPVTFSQLSHWQMHGLGMRSCVRQIASATRLTGELDVTSLRAALAEIVARHQALRTRIISVAGDLTQHISGTGHCELEFVDLSSVHVDLQRDEIQRQIDELILTPVHLDKGPLTGVRLLKLRDQEHVLVIAMEHMISDAVSMNILLRDVLTAYRQLCAGQSVSLPAVAIQFADYATWQSEAHSLWLQKHGEYWERRLHDSQRLRFPFRHAAVESRSGWESVPVRIEVDVKQRLKQWCRQHQTTLVLAVFTAYVAAVMRWCSATDAVFRFQIDGRSDSRLEHTIGYLASALHLRFQLNESDTFVDLLEKVTKEYCMAYEHSDASYLETRSPQPPYARNCRFNWVPCKVCGNDDDVSAYCAVAATAYTFRNPVLERFEVDSEPSMLLYDSDGPVIGGVNFPRRGFLEADIDMFVRCFGRAIGRLLDDAGMSIRL